MSVKRYNWDRPAPTQVYVLYAPEERKELLKEPLQKSPI